MTTYIDLEPSGSGLTVHLSHNVVSGVGWFLRVALFLRTRTRYLCLSGGYLDGWFFKREAGRFRDIFKAVQ